MTSWLDGIVWLCLLVGPLLFLQRRLHREIQGVFLLLTRRPEITLALFSLLFLPGVLLHEMSHFLAARLLRVRTGRLSILPHPLENGRLQLGFVETVPTDIIRDALIGAAPLISGGLFVTYAGLVRLGLDTLWDGFVNESIVGFWRAFVDLPTRVDYWLWFYLAFTVSSTMLPSSSDRRAWLSVALVLGSLLGLTLIVGAGPWLMDNLASPLNMTLRGLAIVLGISILLHLVLLIPIVFLRYFLSRLTGYEVV